MVRSTSAFIILSSLLAAGCGQADQQEQRRPPDAALKAAPGAGPTQAQALKPWEIPERRLAVFSDGDAVRARRAPPAGWTERPLFASDWNKHKSLAGPLQRYVIYENTDRIAAKGVAKGAFATAETQPDLAIITPMSLEEEQTQLTARYLSKMDNSAGLLDHWPAGLLEGVATPRVRLAILDSLAEIPAAQLSTWLASGGSLGVDDAGEPLELTHGGSILHLARTLLCIDGRCGAQLSTRQALALRATAVAGDVGSFGSIADLAVCIREEVDDWVAERATTGEEHLVINLSLGWHPEFTGGLSPSAHPWAQVVYDALGYAQSQGALVVAAAGNWTGPDGLDETPLLPAAWASPTAGVQPVLYAAASVDDAGNAVSASRPDGLPHLMGYGDHVAVAVKDGPAPGSTWPYTGTSMGTAVVSASAAFYWNAHPELTADAVMTGLYAGAVATNVAVTPYFQSPSLFSGAAEARQVKLCALFQALDAAACKEGAALAPLTFTNTASLVAKFEQEAHAVGACPRVHLLLDENGAPPNPTPPEEEICPYLTMESGLMQPYVFPQPAHDCPYCDLLLGEGTLNLRVPGTTTYVNPILILWWGTEDDTFDLDSVDVHYATVDVSNIENLGTVTAARVAYIEPGTPPVYWWSDVEVVN